MADKPAPKAIRIGTDLQHLTAAIRPPSLALTLIEPTRALFEMAGLIALSPLLAMSARGDGHPVVVLPGFATNDTMTGLLRTFLSLLGYNVFPMDLGWNFDQHTVGENGEHIAERISSIRKDTGRKVSLVGWSLGGVIAREAARRDPEDLRQVISLGSPFSGNPRATNLKTFYEFSTGNHHQSERVVERFRTGAEVLPIPSTAVFSRTDGITAWENCIGDTDAINENVEVISSHFGFVANPAVFHVVADRLGKPEGEWTPFVPQPAFASFFA